MNKHSIAALIAAAALAGCSSQPSSLAGAGGLPQGNVIAQHLARGHSWMMRGAASQELVYVSSQGVWDKQGVYVYSYPQGKRVGFLQPDTEETYQGLCSDTHGNVWVVGWITNGQTFFDEYAHGGTQQINAYSGYGVPSGCSVDPTTGDLAVANYVDGNIQGRRGDIAVYASGSNKPTDYYDNSIKYYYYCAYDDKGNLYADGDENYINVLASKSSTLRHVYFNKTVTPGSLQWSAGTLTMAKVGGAKGPVRVDRVTIQGSGAQVTGTTSLQTLPSEGNYLDAEFWIQGKVIAGPGPTSAGPTKALYFWPYPAGGKASKTITAPDNGNFYGVTVSP
jgi:hypothetical protein